MSPATASVVIPCYRQAHFLPDAVESALAQSLAPKDVIVIDDGSPDDVASVVRRFPGVHHIRQENRGLSAARNSGLALCTSDFVCFLDADDRLLPNALEEGARALQDQPTAALAWGFNRLIDGKGDPIPRGPRLAPARADYIDLLRGNVIGPPLTVLYRREMLNAAGGFSVGISPGEDYDCYLRLARRHPTVCHARVIAEYRWHGANMSADTTGTLRAMMEALERQEPFVADDPALSLVLKDSLKGFRAKYDSNRRLDIIRGQVRSRRFLSASMGVADLLAHHPMVFLGILRVRLSRLVPLPRL